MNVVEYLTHYAPELAEKIEQTFVPMQVRGDTSLPLPKLSREPIGGQGDAIRAIAKTMWQGQKTVNVIGEMGVGKTLCALAAIHLHADGKPYRAIVMCPPHLTSKWVREILTTIPAARPRIVERYHELTKLAALRPAPIAPEYYVMAESMAKMGTPWKPAFVRKGNDGILHCPACYEPIRRNGDDEDLEFMDEEELAKRQHQCSACESPLWSWTHEYERWPVASYIHRKMRGLFDYAVLDELHNYAASDSAVAISMSKLVQSVRHVLPLTGTYLNGYAHSVMHLLWRTSPETLQTLGFGYGETTAFAQRYGRLQKTIKYKNKGEANRESRGSSGRTTVKVLPGVMPTLFGDHLLDKSVFISLEDISSCLPKLESTVVGVDMDAEQAAAYSELELRMPMAIELAMRSKNTSLLTQLIQALMGYTDFPHKYGELGYHGEDGWEAIARPRDLDPDVIRPKEQELLDRLVAEAAEGRQSWVFVEMTQKRDVQARLQKLIKKAGLRVKVLRSGSVPTKAREEWIAANAPGIDVMVSHPQLVSTGLDLYDREGTYNFPTLMFYQTGLHLSTLRQASRRSWRIGQPLDCKVLYLYYKSTMQQRFVELMAAKLQAAEAIDGRFTTEGLSSLSDAGESMGLALAKSLLESIKQRRRGGLALAV